MYIYISVAILDQENYSWLKQLLAPVFRGDYEPMNFDTAHWRARQAASEHVNVQGHTTAEATEPAAPHISAGAYMTGSHTLPLAMPTELLAILAKQDNEQLWAAKSFLAIWRGNV